MSLNRQNQHIADRLQNIAETCDTLINMGLTILSIKLEGPSPEISIQASYGCRQLDPAIKKMTVEAGVRRTTRVAIINHCQITWKENH